MKLKNIKLVQNFKNIQVAHITQQEKMVGLIHLIG
jgi:hypothetical protein